MNDVYIIISRTGTILSKIIGLITGDEYCHASLSLDKELEHMYSFGRLHPYNPFWGGFVQESPYYGTFKRFKNTSIIMIRLNVTDEAYDKLNNLIKEIDQNKKFYSYNYIGLALAVFGVCYKHKNCYYCSEFVRDTLVQANILDYSIKEIIKPEQFINIPISEIVYTGLLRAYGTKAGG